MPPPLPPAPVADVVVASLPSSATLLDVSNFTELASSAPPFSTTNKLLFPPPPPSSSALVLALVPPVNGLPALTLYLASPSPDVRRSDCPSAIVMVSEQVMSPVSSMVPLSPDSAAVFSSSHDPTATVVLPPPILNNVGSRYTNVHRRMTGVGYDVLVQDVWYD